MAKAKKLPSGNWRVRVYSHTDASGKQHYESFTARTKQEAEMKAAKFANDVDRNRSDDITVEKAVMNYIEANRNVLSPATINGYRTDARRLKPISNIRIRKISSNDIQQYINSLVESGLSPKTVKNTWGLLHSALQFSGLEQQFRIHLPPNPHKKKTAPEMDVIKRLYDAAPRNMKIAIRLAAQHSLRRGEICSLKYKDLDGDVLYVHSDMVKSEDGHSWVYKETPKTDTSNREIYLDEDEVALIGTGDPEDYIIGLLPSGLNSAFFRIKETTGINIRFHDLRVFFASISAAKGVPEIFTASQGGWKEGSPVLREAYKRPIKSLNEHHARKLNEYFRNII